jgi:RNA polymerase sigma-70 factor (ECF subfamily)
MDPEHVQTAHKAGSSLFPSVDHPFEVFSEWISAAGIQEQDLRSHGTDLFLASACARGDRAAHRHFDGELLARLTRREVGADLSPDDLAELRQRLRLDLIGGPDAKINQYRGRGPLRAWVRVCAARSAIRLNKSIKHPRESDRRVLEELVDQDASPELRLVRSRYQDTLAAALEECFLALPDRDKTLLRMSFLDGLNIDQIGLAFQVHRSTVARWLLAIRRRVLDQLGAKLALNLDTTSSEFRSVVRLLQTDIHVSLSRVLATNAGLP